MYIGDNSHGNTQRERERVEGVVGYNIMHASLEMRP